ncbi:uncharacterized protein LOC110246250 [Exaiptasia diaphana]|uniref:Transcriptional regulator n=1 Tax=Exaiptasia diaphana TaxID=2652724 RepID=A0A913XQS2_EXADI|nr:uncharacterized protein LOC110246250 [Exaiptasia diaphana]
MNEQEKYIEQVGLFYEQFGLPKMAGRILGYLISSSTKNNSFQDCMDALKASKGSISGNIKLLLSQNMIEKHMVSGSRQSYYRIASDSLNRLIEAKVASISQFKVLLEAGLSLNETDDSEQKKELQNIVRYYAFLEQEIPLLKQKWDELNN